MDPVLPDRSVGTIEGAVREAWGQVLATLIRDLRDLDLAEDVLQDAVVAALEHWPRDGRPAEPRAWLLQTARRKAIDRFRRDAALRARRPQLEQLARAEESARQETEEGTAVDERLSLIFMCCHPALGEQSRVELTLRALGGLSTGEIARAFLVPEPTMAQRLVRAKGKIKAAGIPYRVPPPELWPERLAPVLAVVYFIFNEGYAATTGDAPTRADLCAEALRLGRILAGLAPHEPEVLGLLALMLLHDSRRAARIDAAGEFVTLERQDRSLWNREQIELGRLTLERALGLGRVGPYQVQAAISAVHATATSHETTDWHEIVLLYRKLSELQPSLVVALNGAVAVSFAEGAAAGLAALEALGVSRALAHYQPLHAARADMLRRAGRASDAALAYRRAIELTTNAVERRFLERRLAEVEASGRD